MPTQASVTAGNGSEYDPLRAAVQSGRLYVIDRGYAQYQLCQDIHNAGSGFIGRVRDLFSSLFFFLFFLRWAAAQKYRVTRHNSSRD